MRAWVDWGPHLVYWVEDDKSDPDIDWPKNWEVCRYPNRNPLALRDEDKRPGNVTLAMPMYHVLDMIEELQHICSFLERMPQCELEKWLALQDRQLTFSCSDPEMDAADVNSRGFEIPGPVLLRVRSLRLRLMIGFHPAAEVVWNSIY
jgi:hypothetical protein